MAWLEEHQNDCISELCPWGAYSALRPSCQDPLARKAAKSVCAVAAFVPSACLSQGLASFLLPFFLSFLFLSHACFF